MKVFAAVALHKPPSDPFIFLPAFISLAAQYILFERRDNIDFLIDFLFLFSFQIQVLKKATMKLIHHRLSQI